MRAHTHNIIKKPLKPMIQVGEPIGRKPKINKIAKMEEILPSF